MHKQEMTQSRLEMELGSMQDHIWNEYDLTYENAAALKREIAVWRQQHTSQRDQAGDQGLRGHQPRLD